MKLLFVAASVATLACASAPAEAPQPVAAAQTQTQPANVGLAAYEGTYAMQAPSRLITMRVWLNAEGTLNAELVGMGDQTTFRHGDAEHKFMHATRDDVTFQFTVENGRATAVTMRQGERQISGPRTN